MIVDFNMDLLFFQQSQQSSTILPTPIPVQSFVPSDDASVNRFALPSEFIDYCYVTFVNSVFSI